MRNHWLALTVGLALVIGTASAGLIAQAGGNQVAIDPGWRFYEGHWNYWDPDDRAWYHTDGRNWYTYNNNAWNVYGFDRNFGRTSFREGYVVPKPGPNVVIPRHRVYVPR
jgi:hypothetical protein